MAFRQPAAWCRARSPSPIEMSLSSPIEMSLGQAVVETFGVTSDGGDPDERAGTDPVACADRSGGQAADSRGGWHIDGCGATAGLSPAPCLCASAGPTALVSRKRGRASNRRHRETFRQTVLALVRQHYLDFGPTLAAEKLAARHGLQRGRRDTAAVDDRRLDYGKTVGIACPPHISHVVAETAWVNWCRSTARSMPGSRIVARCARLTGVRRRRDEPVDGAAVRRSRNRRSTISGPRAPTWRRTANPSRSTATNTTSSV